VDSPCSGGTIVDVHPGRADPNAKERLARAQAELDRAAVLRRANEQEAARRDELAQLRRQSESGQSMAEPASDVYYGTGYDAYGPYMQRRTQRSTFHGGGRGHRSLAKDRFHVEHRVPAVIRGK
jgi:acyl-CoA reductase-like NAD-dependent aldehyde dehydrogenase